MRIRTTAVLGLFWLCGVALAQKPLYRVTFEQVSVTTSTLEGNEGTNALPSLEEMKALAALPETPRDWVLVRTVCDGVEFREETRIGEDRIDLVLLVREREGGRLEIQSDLTVCLDGLSRSTRGVSLHYPGKTVTLGGWTSLGRREAMLMRIDRLDPEGNGGTPANGE